jgi:hypothetical protein
MSKKKLPPEVLAYFTRMGKRGGASGGLTRAKHMTPEQRSEAARLAVRARWAKHKAREGPTAKNKPA